MAYLRDIERQGGSFLVRSTSHLNPRVLSAYREDGRQITSCQDRELKAITSKFPKQQRTALEVAWLIEGEPFRARLIVSWNPQDTCCGYL